MDMLFPGSAGGGMAGMPAAVPGLGGASPMLGGGQPAAPIGAPAFGGMPGPQDPASAQYVAVTQSDGSILLHIKNPDGSAGPAVKIINPIKPRQQAAAPPM